MPQISIEIDSKAVARKIKVIPRLLDRNMQQALTRSVLQVERNAKGHAPFRTGRLKASIGGGTFMGGSFSEGTGRTIHKLKATIMPTVAYALWASRRAKDPLKRGYMAKGLKQSVPFIEKVFNDAVRKAIK